jgi:hypothetical protein
MRILASVVLAAMLAGCSAGAPGATTPSVAISQDQAVAAARAASPDGASFVSARLGPLRGFDGDLNVPGNPLVWAVTFTGSFPLGCGPAPVQGSTPGPCPPPATSTTVFVDAGTGTFVAGAMPAIK